MKPFWDYSELNTLPFFFAKVFGVMYETQKYFNLFFEIFTKFTQTFITIHLNENIVRFYSNVMLCHSSSNDAVTKDVKVSCGFILMARTYTLLPLR